MDVSVEDREVEFLIGDLLEYHGYDFSEYARASLKRRINRLYSLDKFASFTEFRYRIITDKEYLNRFVEQITVNVTEMFRDPHFFQTLRKEVLPVLATYPFIRIWHAGCSTGEEVFSMAILLKEFGLLNKTLLYATDINPEVVHSASTGIFPIRHMKTHTENYRLSGGAKDFSEYYIASGEHVLFDTELKKRMVFATHNLVTESSFNQFQLIMCRNVLIYFEKGLQSKVFKLFDQSLEKLGFLALGSRETLKFSPISPQFKQVKTDKIWRKMQ
ncbi:MAG: protein-glutamate O-methyltransferase CheR [Mucilaginibacter polytrichastri]|nr:protein-glutamate O-methyltransferase CheR [Mucilaginibacter polytrichastri]